MNRYETAILNPGLRDLLNRRNVDELKRMLALVSDARLNAPRKADVVEALARRLLGGDLVGLWNRLPSLEQSAVAEAVHTLDGIFDQDAFLAKYRKLPQLETEGSRPYDKCPTLLRLFIHPVENGAWGVPMDLREKLRAFVSKAPEAQLASLELIPDRPPRKRTSRYFDTEKHTTIYESLDAPLVQRLTEQAAIQDLQTILRLVDQEKLSVSATTLLPSKASTKLLYDLLRERDFFDLTEKRNDWQPEIGPIKGFSWPLLVQAAKLAVVRDGKLSLTKLGRTALETPPAQTLRDLWTAWLGNKIIDELSRIEAIKGQRGKGGRSLTPPVDRRRAIQSALAKCPVGRWVETDEFSRYMQAAGFRFEVTSNAWALYLCDPQYGSLGYAGHGGWNILQERYLLCLLFEYASPLGMIDVAYEHPGGARTDFKGQWGTDDLAFLSRYDGLRYFRLTPLGAFILGAVESYEPPQTKPDVSLTVLPNRHIRIDRGALSPNEVLLLEGFADPETAQLWSLNEAKALQSVEKGVRVAEFRAFLSARDPQPLPEAVEAFLLSAEQPGAACVCKGSCLLIECLSQQ
ncbi:MAG TPA: hypothetical protein VL970_10650, partial [Candidatus Acidoferrales bacterium]|nr:hypothetical protein [Candidatus Acidoferrales bacterium]